MKLLADENIPDDLVDLLSTAGHNIKKVISGSKDLDIAFLAKREGRIILSQDKHFANIIWYPPSSLRGIIRLKFHPPIISEMLDALESLFKKFSQKNLDKKLVILENDGFRIR